MDDKNKDEIEFDEPSFEDFLPEEKDPQKERRKKWRTVVIRTVASLIALVFLLNGLATWIPVFNLPAFDFVKASVALSQKDEIQRYKEAVVSIEGSDKKGTGFNISPDGKLITNYHVIEDMNPMVVYFPDGQVFHAELIKGDRERDLAILDIKGVNLPVLALAKKESWEEGDAIYVIGNPLGFYQIANQGKISGQKMVSDTKVSVMSITAPVYRGNSGSPVINEKGKVVGVVFATSIPRAGERPEGFVIPIEEVLSRLPN